MYDDDRMLHKLVRKKNDVVKYDFSLQANGSTHAEHLRERPSLVTRKVNDKKEI